MAEKRRVHRALAEATDPQSDPTGGPGIGSGRGRARRGRRHGPRGLGRAGVGARRCGRRGGVSRARGDADIGAGRRARRLLAAAEAKRDAGALDAALGCWCGPKPDPRRVASGGVEYLRGEIAFDQLRVREAVNCCRARPGASSRCAPSHPARLVCGIGCRDVAGRSRRSGTSSIRNGRRSRCRPGEPAATAGRRRLLDAFVAVHRRLRGRGTLFNRAIEMLLSATSSPASPIAGPPSPAPRWAPPSPPRYGTPSPGMRWLCARRSSTRRPAPHIHLQFALHYLAWTLVLRGEFEKAAGVVDEDRATAAATGNPPLRFGQLLLAAWRGRREKACEFIEATMAAAEAGGKCKVADFAALRTRGPREWTRPPRRRTDRHQTGLRPRPRRYWSPGDPGAGRGRVAYRQCDLLPPRHDWMAVRVQATPTPWALGINSRIGALLSEGDLADSLYRESLEHLGRTQVGLESARGHLIYGEWLRRQNRRIDARAELRLAEEMFSAMGADGFADRARRELMATGESARKRSVDTGDDLTPQELQVARLAQDGLSNPEIGGQLFISPRTVQYHLRKVFAKLGIRSRSELAHVLPGGRVSARAQRLVRVRATRCASTSRRMRTTATD